MRPQRHREEPRPGDEGQRDYEPEGASDLRHGRRDQERKADEERQHRPKAIAQDASAKFVGPLLHAEDADHLAVSETGGEPLGVGPSPGVAPTLFIDTALKTRVQSTSTFRADRHDSIRGESWGIRREPRPLARSCRSLRREGDSAGWPTAIRSFRRRHGACGGSGSQDDVVSPSGQAGLGWAETGSTASDMKSAGASIPANLCEIRKRGLSAVAAATPHEAHSSSAASDLDFAD